MQAETPPQRPKMPSPSPNRQRPDLLHRTFEVRLLLKGLYAVVEPGSAALFWLVKPESLRPWLLTLTASELAEDPHDLIGNWILQAGGRYSPDVQHFAIFYLGIRWTQTHAIILVPLGAFDLVMMWLVQSEYRWIRADPARPRRSVVST